VKALLARAFGAGAALRVTAYRRGLLSRKHLRGPVISVGNLSVGGSGKTPVVAYLDILDQAWPPDKEAPITIVVLPEYVARHWWDRLLYNQTAKRLKTALVGREHELERYARTLGASIREDGIRKILAGATTLEEVVRVSRAD